MRTGLGMISLGKSISEALTHGFLNRHTPSSPVVADHGCRNRHLRLASLVQFTCRRQALLGPSFAFFEKRPRPVGLLEEVVLPGGSGDSAGRSLSVPGGAPFSCLNVAA